MITLLISGAASLLFTVFVTPLLIAWLRSHGIGQQIRDDGPQRHATKAGTPTMGGACIVAGAAVGYLAPHVRHASSFTRGGLLVTAAMIGAGLLGAADDWIKVRHQRSLGLNKKAKILGQLAVATAFAYGCVHWAHVSTNLSFTRSDSINFDLGQWGWIVFAVLVIVATSNAVNLTDGLDGLAAGSSAFSFAGLTVIAFWQFRHFDVYHVNQALDLAVLAIALVSACTGFLWWNAAPAHIFMGDTGSLAIGTALAGLALVMNVHLLLPIIGALFVGETLSVIVQVASFRIFHRRVFRMAPIHHHYELLGWPETTVIIRFWILASLFMALALGLFYGDFLKVAPDARRRLTITTQVSTQQSLISARLTPVTTGSTKPSARR